MVKPGSIKIIGTESAVKYIIEYYDEGPREIQVHWVVAKIVSAAIEQGKLELRADLKKALEG